MRNILPFFISNHKIDQASHSDGNLTKFQRKLYTNSAGIKLCSGTRITGLCSSGTGILSVTLEKVINRQSGNFYIN